MTKYLLENITTYNDKKVLNFIKITDKTIKHYFKFEKSQNIVCVGNHYLLDFYKAISNINELKCGLSRTYQEITKNDVEQF